MEGVETRGLKSNPECRALPYPQTLWSHKCFAGSELLLGKGAVFVGLYWRSAAACLGRCWLSLAGAGLSLHGQQIWHLLPCPSLGTQPFSPFPCPRLFLSQCWEDWWICWAEIRALWAAASVLFLLPAVFLTLVQPEQSRGL